VRVPFRSREQRRGRHVAIPALGGESPSGESPEEEPYPGPEALEEPIPEASRAGSPETVDADSEAVDPDEGPEDASAESDRESLDLGESEDPGDRDENNDSEMKQDDSATSDLQLPELSESRRPVTGTRVMAVANQKGGVGKTTTAVNLGACLAELGFRVLVVDLDPQGNATTGLGIEARNFENSMYDVMMKDLALDDCIEPTSIRNLFVAPATIDLAGAEIELVPAFSREFKLRKAIQSVIEDFDYVLIDCPPSLGLITINGLAAANEVLVPIQCEYYALEGLGQLLRNVQLVQSNLNETLEVSTIVLTMYDARTKLADQVASEVRAHFGARVCRIVIPRTVRISEAPSFGQPITVFDPTSRGAIAYRELAKEVSGVET
jgi:chromosome partitioning protein